MLTTFSNRKQPSTRTFSFALMLLSLFVITFITNAFAYNNETVSFFPQEDTRIVRGSKTNDNSKTIPTEMVQMQLQSNQTGNFGRGGNQIGNGNNGNGNQAGNGKVGGGPGVNPGAGCKPEPCPFTERKLSRTVVTPWVKVKTEARGGGLRTGGTYAVAVVTWECTVYNVFTVFKCSLQKGHAGPHHGTAAEEWVIAKKLTEVKEYGVGVPIDPPKPIGLPIESPKR